jgi:hypothetical protein
MFGAKDKTFQMILYDFDKSWKCFIPWQKIVKSPAKLEEGKFSSEVTRFLSKKYYDLLLVKSKQCGMFLKFEVYYLNFWSIKLWTAQAFSSASHHTFHKIPKFTQGTIEIIPSKIPHNRCHFYFRKVL